VQVWTYQPQAPGYSPILTRRRFAVLIEIEAALRKKIPVVPILVDGMSMRGAEDFQTRFGISDSETRFCPVDFMTSTRMQIA
jgi:hypothetical protein